MAYSKRKAIMIQQLVEMFGEDEVSFSLGIKIDSIKRAIRYARKVCLK
jgi:hypothetical protein